VPYQFFLSIEYSRMTGFTQESSSSGKAGSNRVLEKMRKSENAKRSEPNYGKLRISSSPSPGPLVRDLRRFPNHQRTECKSFTCLTFRARAPRVHNDETGVLLALDVYGFTRCMVTPVHRAKSAFSKRSQQVTENMGRRTKRNPRRGTSQCQK